MRPTPFSPDQCATLAALMLWTAAGLPAGAHPTDNCKLEDAPPACQDLARPRTLRIMMIQRFEPNRPRIEVGDCIAWAALGSVHASAGTSSAAICSDLSCPHCEEPTCFWETNFLGAQQTSICHYDEPTFMPDTSLDFCCRYDYFRGALGILAITSKINLVVDKDSALGNVELTWTGGGVGGDERFKVWRSRQPDFPQGALTLEHSVLGRSFSDGGQLSDPDDRYYLITNDSDP